MVKKSKVFRNSIMSSASLLALVTTGVAFAQPVVESDVLGTNGDDLITETSVDFALAGDAEVRATGVNARGGNDTVRVDDFQILSADAVKLGIDVLTIDSLEPAEIVRAISTGISGGAGDDVLSAGGGEVSSSSTGGLIDFNIIDGSGDTANLGMEFRSIATGINGASGADSLINTGSFQISATSRGTQDNINLGGLDFIDFSSSLTANALARGLHGANGENTFTSSGLLSVDALAQINLNNTDIGLFSISSGNGNLVAAARATGIQGGADPDIINSSGGANITSSASIDQADFTFSFDDVSDYSSTGVANATSTGFLTGGGNDSITLSDGVHRVRSEVDLDSTSVSFAVIGLNARDNTFSGTAQSTGISSGVGNDEIIVLDGPSLDPAGDNIFELDVSADAARSIFGLSVNALDLGPTASYDPDAEMRDGLQSQSEIKAISAGVFAGDGADSIDLRGDVSSRANSAISATAISTTIEAVPTAPWSGNQVDINMIAIGRADGVIGGAGEDSISVFGDLIATSSATSENSVSSVSVPVELPIPLVGASGAASVFLSAGSEASSTARGLNGGDDADFIQYFGSNLSVSSDAASRSTLVFLDAIISLSEPPDPPLGEIPTVEYSLLAATAESTSRADGFQGGAGNDSLLLGVGAIGNVTANATAENIAVAIEMSLDASGSESNTTTTSLDIGGFDTQAMARSVAAGFSGGDGADILSNNGTLDVLSTANAKSGSYRGGARVNSDNLGFDIVRMQNMADARAISQGMVGGSGADRLINIGALTTDAISTATLEDVSASLNYGADLSVGFVSFDTSANARSTALGLAARDETLATDNRGTLTTAATANANNLGIVTSIDYVESGVSLNGFMMQTDIESVALARGIQSQSSSAIANSGRVETTANAVADSIKVDAAIALAKDSGVVGGVSLQSSTLSASSNASGLWGTNDSLFFLNTGELITRSSANSDATLVDVDVQATTAGLAFDIGVLDAETVATAIGAGIRGRGAQARADNTGSISVIADADSDATSVTAGLNVAASSGFTLSGALTNAATTAKSAGFGMQLFTDSAEILNGGAIDVTSTATSNADAINVAAGFVGTGLILNASAIDANSLATANGFGIQTRNATIDGIGNDTIRQSAGLNVLAAANADSDAVTVNLDLVRAGVSLGAAALDAGSTARSFATGVSTGSGFDFIEFAPLSADEPGFAGDLFQVDAISNVNNSAVGLDIDIALSGGVSSSNAVIEAISLADADAIGFDAGQGNDNVIVNGVSTIDAASYIRGATIGVALSGSGGGITGGASLTDLAQTATARAEGVRGGLGADNLLNNSTITTQAVSDVRGVGVSIGGGFAVGAAGGASISDVTTTSNSRAVGMGGNSFSTGGDEFTNILTNSGLLATNAVSVASADAISIRADVAALPVSIALAEASTTTDARATGMAGASGNDQFFNSGAITTYSRATSAGVSANVGLAGGGLGDVSTNANAVSRGIDGGRGIDRIETSGNIDTRALATTGSQAISVSGLGLAGSNTRTGASSTSTGILAGAGADLIDVTGDLRVDATTKNHAATDEDGFADAIGAGTLNFNLNFVGAALDDAGSIFDATAVGIDGGADNDRISVSGTTTNINATSNLRQSSISLQGAGAIIGNVGLTSNATSTGVFGGGGVDQISNDTIINSLANATAIANQVSIQGIGFEADFGSLSANSSAFGLSGGNGNDTLTNMLGIRVESIASVENNNVDVRLVGGGVGSSNSIANARAIGMDGGAGSDTIVNNVVLSALSRARTRTSNTQVSIADVSFLDSTRFSVSEAIGMSGDRGADTIDNFGLVRAIADATLSSSSVSFNLIGGGQTDASIEASASATGIDGGAGADVVTLHDVSKTIAIACAAAEYDIGSQSCNPGESNTVAINLVGGTQRDGDLVFRSSTVGVDLGDGADVLTSLGDISAFSTTDFRSSSLAVTGAGYTGEATDSAATAVAFGVASGDGNDSLSLGGSISSNALANLAVDSLDVTLLGYSAADSIFGATASATGIDGGTGDDTVLFDGLSLTAHSGSLIESTFDRFNAAGAISVDSILTAGSEANGFVGGEGNDRFTLAGFSDVEAQSDVRISGGSLQFIGGTVTSSGVTAESVAIGASGGAGNNTIIFAPESDQTVFSRAGVVASNGTDIGFGGSTSRAATIAEAVSYGVQGGADDDIIQTAGNLSVISDTGSTARSVSFVLSGSGSTDLTANASSTATGIAGGGGFNDIANSGNLVVSANSRAVGSDAALVVIASSGSQTRSGADTVSRATAFGITGGDGRDIINNFGSIDVDVRAGSTINNSAAAGGVWVNSQTNSHVFSFMTAAGISSGASENDVVLNQGVIAVDLSSAVTGSESTSARSISSNDNTFSINADAGARAVASMNDLRALGIEMGVGDGEIQNSGSISVSINTQAFAFPETQPGGISGADGTSRAIVGVSGGVLAGIQALGGGDKIVVNDGSISALMAPRARATAIAEARGINIGSETDADATATIDMNNNRAYGIHVGDGNDQVVNRGTITVENRLNLNRARAIGRPGGSDPVDAFATTFARINGVYGYGVRADGGDNTIINDGLIDVIVAPYAEASSNSTGRGFDGDAESRATATITNLFAIGIETGNGSDTIVNTGTINVAANPTMVAGSAASPAEFLLDINGSLNGEAVRATSTSATSIFSYGIRSNGGDDNILNSGTITTSRSRGSGGVEAISTGTGNDTVELGASSTTIGAISMSSGDDRLIINGGAVFNGAVLGSSGIDTLELVGAGTFSNTDIRTLDILEKSGSGHYRIESPYSTWRNVVINEGTLTATTVPVATAGLETFVDGSGRVGTFETGAGYRLSGDFTLNAGPNPFTDGQRFRVINANSLTFAPSEENLPIATPLLSFDIDVALSTVDAVASVSAFTSAAATSDQLSLAQSFDDTLAAGDLGFYDTDLAYVLGGIQKLSSVGDIQAAYDALIPAVSAPDATMIGAVSAGVGDVVQDSLSFVRTNLVMAQGSTSNRLGYMGMDYTDQTGGLSWIADLSGELGVNSIGAKQSFDTEARSFMAGVNMPLGKRSALGVSFGLNAQSSVDELNGIDRDSEDTFAYIYGTHLFGENLFVDGVAGYSALHARGDEFQAAHSSLDLSNEDSASVSGEFRIGKMLESGTNTNLEFYMLVGYSDLDFNGEGQTSVMGLGQNVSLMDRSHIETGFGMRLDGNLETRLGPIAGSVDLQYVHDLQYNAGGSRVQFDQAPDHPFFVGRFDRTRDALQARWGTRWSISGSTHLDFIGKGELREKGSVGTFKLKVTSRF